MPVQNPDSTIPMRAFLAGARRKEPEMLEMIRQLVRAESPSDDKAAVDACMALAAARAKALGGRVKLHRQRGFGDLLEARFGPKPSKGAAKTTLGAPGPDFGTWETTASSASQAVKPILLLGHLDTVWPLGTLKTMPCRMSEGRLRGPGTLDMKAGVVMAFTALEMLIETGELKREIVLLLNSDEEVGSPVSRPVTERLAAECSAVYVLEGALGLAVKTARKGTGNWRIEVQGKAAHAGVDFEKGSNAIRELARVIETVSGWTDLARGLTINVGVAAGGSKSNVIAAEAWAEVDVRIARKSDGPRIARKFARLKPIDKGCTLTLTGGINRPPMERTSGTARLYRQARALAAELGITLDEASTGGASDGNFTSALGVPTLDGLGAVGEGAHAAHEFISVEHLAPRTALLAGLLAG